MDAENATTPRDVQNELYLNMCNENWTRFTKADYQYLKMKIAYALCGLPTENGDMAEITETLNGYTSRQQQSIIELYELIKSHAKFSLNNEDIFLSIVFVVCMQPKVKVLLDNIIMPDNAWDNLETRSDIVMWIVPVFAIRRCHPINYIPGNEPCRVYIDSECRVYNSWNAYLTNNKLSQCHMLVPDNGMYKNLQDEPCFSVKKSPSCSTTSKVLKVTDVGGAAVSIGAAAGAVVGGPVIASGAIIAGVATGVYGFFRSGVTLKDRADHQQSINITDSEARGCWLNIGLSTVGLGAGAATSALRQVAASGSGATKLGLALQKTVDVFRIANLGVSGIGLANGLGSCVYKWTNYEELPSTLECFQLAASILFFTNAVVTNKTASQIVSDVEAQTISDYRDSLRSNRHRKIFDKMAKETRRTDGNVVKSIRSIGNKDEFFASVIKMNKELNKNGVKVSFNSDGTAQLNGQHSVNPADMYSLGAGKRANIYTKLDPPPSTSRTATNYSISSNNVSVLNTETSCLSHVPKIISSLFTQENVNTTITVGVFVFQRFDFDSGLERISVILSNYTETVYNALLQLILDLLKGLEGDASEMFGIMFRNSERIYQVFEFIRKFVRSQTNGDTPTDERNNIFNFLEELFRNGRAEPETIRVILIEFYDWIRNSFVSIIEAETWGDCKICGYQGKKFN